MAEISRRTLLATLAGLAAGAGLGLAKGIRHKVAVPPPPAPTALTDALARQQRLLAGYDAVLSGHYAGWPAVGGMRSDVAAHGDALRALLDRYPGWRLASAGGSAAAAEPTASLSSPAISASTSSAPTGPASASSASTSSASASSAPASSASTSPAPASSASARGMTVDQLASVTAADAKALTDAALAWPATEQHAAEVVPTLGSIAACLASHLQELTG